jgi:acyl-[acyl carrier protein]--UDP-N-acetylglucosamine O-acyltransferase
VLDSAKVFGKARIYDNAQLSGEAKVFGRARVYGKAKISDSASVSGSAYVFGEAQVAEHAQVYGKAQIYDKAEVRGLRARVADSAWVFGEAHILQEAFIWGEARVYGKNARVSGNAEVKDKAQVTEESEVLGRAKVFGSAVIAGHARVEGKAQVSGHATVLGNAEVSEGASVFGSSKVYGDARVFGEALVLGEAQVFEEAEISGGARVSGKSEVSGRSRLSGTARIKNEKMKSGIDLIPLPVSVSVPDPANPLAVGPRVIKEEAQKLPEPEFSLPNDYVAFANRSLRPFAGSEASQLKAQWTEKTVMSELIDKCDQLDILSAPPPFMVNAFFKYRENALPPELRCLGGRKFTAGEISMHNLADKFIVALRNPHLFEKYEGVAFSDVSFHAMSQEETKYFLGLKAKISELIEQLNASVQEKDSAGKPIEYFTNRLGKIDADGRLSANLHVNSHPRDKKEFAKLLGAIEKDDEKSFVQQLIRLATNFDIQHQDARQEFIDVMTGLFVTKQFASQEIKAKYLNFFLQCGQLY